MQGTVTETQIKRAYKTLQELLELQKDRSYAEIARIEPRDLVVRGGRLSLSVYNRDIIRSGAKN